MLPKENDFAGLVIKSDLVNKIKITQDEIKEFEIKNLRDGVISWNEKKEKDLEVELTDLETQMVKDILTEMDKEKKLTDEHVELYKKFNA